MRSSPHSRAATDIIAAADAIEQIIDSGMLATNYQHAVRRLERCVAAITDYDSNAGEKAWEIVEIVRAMYRSARQGALRAPNSANDARIRGHLLPLIRRLAERHDAPGD